MSNVDVIECVKQYGWNHFFVDNTTIRFKRYDDYAVFQYINENGMSELKVRPYLVMETLAIIEKEFNIKLKFY